MIWAWAVVLPSTVFMKFVHSFLLAKRECQASADWTVVKNTPTVPIIPAAATTANIAIMVCDWLILALIAMGTLYHYVS